MEEKKNKEVIDFGLLWNKLWTRRILFIKVWAITFVIACIYIYPIPRYYNTSTKLAPEMGGSSLSSGALGSLASSFGFDLGGMETNDAINPTLYPDLMEDNGFVTGLFNIKVTSSDGDISTDYYNYLKYHQKKSIWGVPLVWVKGLFKSKKNKSDTESEFNPYILSEEDYNIAEIIRSNIRFNLDDKTGVITVTATAQDPLVCKILADSVTVYLQDFITKYRTNKARIDLAYYTALADTALTEYREAAKAYSRYADANTNVVLESYRNKLNDLENDMSLKFSTYSALNTQVQAARGKVQERTPVFTQLKGASVPIKPAGPKRMIFVMLMLMLTTAVTVASLLRKDLLKIITIHGSDQ
ncbi:MAG: chain-length determining protein [Prevotella sp.]|nr:chain-length determining protein [Prevotella sp.]